MRTRMPGPGVTVFVLFFGLALLDAFRAHDWAHAAFWVAIGAVFLWADGPRRRPGPAPATGGDAPGRIP